MQEFANPHSLRNGIFDLLSSINLATDDNVKLLDYQNHLLIDFLDNFHQHSKFLGYQYNNINIL